jgi:MFS transporter, PPP family, 3-phenylpropionic acid transporter
VREPPAPAVRQELALTGTFVLFGLVIASFFPFFALFLDSRGLDPSEIGVVVAVMAIARIGSNPVWGSLADARLGRRTVLRITLATGAAAALLLSAFGHTLVSVLLTATLLAACNGSVGPNIDALALTHLGQERMSNYGRIRAWESMSYAAACVLFGVLLQRVGVTWLMAVNALSMAAVLAWTLTLAADRPEHRAEHGRMGAVGAVFRTAPRFWGFLAGSLVLWTGFNGAWNFLALRIESRGGGPLLIGIGTALGGLVEVAVMLSSGRLIRRFGLRSIYALGAATYATAFVLWGLVTSAVLVSVLTVFEGIGFSLLFSSGVQIVGRMLPESLYSTGQSLVSTVAFGMAPIVGGAVGGLVYQQLGAPVLYVGAAVLALAGGAVVWLTLGGRAFRPGAAADRPGEVSAPAPGAAGQP